MENQHVKPFAAISACALLLSLSPDAHAQYTGALGAQFNNGMSATLSVMSQGMSNMAMLRRSLYGSYGSYRSGRPSAAQMQSARGQRLIHQGRAATTFPTRPWPTAYWMAHTIVDTSISAAEDRRIRSSGMLLQRTQFAKQVSQRGARWGDMSDMIAVATVIAVEAYTGQPVSNAGFQAQRRIWSRAWLKDADFQGRTAASKQQLYEELLLGGTYPWYLRSVNKDAAGARKQAAHFLDEWYRDKAAGVIKVYAKYSANGAKGAPETALAAPAPPNPEMPVSSVTAPAPMTMAQAVPLARFKAAPTLLLPDLLAKKESAESQEKSRKRYETLLNAGRERMQNIFTPGPQGEESVADALTFALMTLYTVSKTPSGNISEAGFTPVNARGLNQQITLLLARDPKFRAQSKEQRQKMYESAVLIAVMVGAINGEAQQKKDAALRENARVSANQWLQSLLGVSPDKVRLSDAGFLF